MVSSNPRRSGRVHVVGAGPVGLFLTALLQTVAEQPVRLYERRTEYTRTRMVSLAPYLVADSIESYRADTIDGQDVEAVFDPIELETRLAYRRSVSPDLRALLEEWTRGFVPLNTIESSLSGLIDARATGTVERITTEVSADEAIGMLEPGDVLVDCTGSRSVLRDMLMPGDGVEEARRNTKRFRLEYALVVTFLYGQHYACNEYCKYYKNVGNAHYKFIPAVSRTSFDGSVSHVTGIVNISAEDFAAMPSQFDGAWLRAHFPEAARSMDRFIEKIRQESHGEIIGNLDIIRIPLDLYRARSATNRRLLDAGTDEQAFTRGPVFLAGDSAMGSPYFQSISLGFECAMFLAGLLGQRELPLGNLLDRYELFTYKQWLRVYARSKMIKHNKDLLQLVDDTDGLLAKLHVF